MKLGFIGTGAITSPIVTGLSSTADAAYTIRLSPRNREIAADLAARFAGVSVASSNREVLDWCETVVLAIRPQIARSVLAELCFRPDHRVISLISGLSMGSISALVSPAVRIIRAVPLPSTAKRECATPVFPEDRDAIDLFTKLGTAFAAQSEGEFDALCAATATVASYFAFAETIAAWLAGHGVPPGRARDYLARMLHGLNAAALEAPQRSFDSLSRDHTTRGGTNEQLLAHLNALGVFPAVSDGLDAILRRIAPSPDQR